MAYSNNNAAPAHIPIARGRLLIPLTWKPSSIRKRATAKTNVYLSILHVLQLFYSWCQYILLRDKRLYFFLLGAIAYRFYVRNWQNKQTASSAVLWGWMIGIFYFVMLMQSREAFITLHWKTLYYSLPVITAIFLPILFRLSRQSKPDRWIGGISYPLCLSHTIIGSYLLEIRANNTYVAFLVIFVVSAATHHFIERPLNRFRHRYFAAR